MQDRKSFNEALRRSARDAHWRALARIRCPLSDKAHLSVMSSREFYLTDLAVFGILKSCRQTPRTMKSPPSLDEAVIRAMDSIPLIESFPHLSGPVRERCARIVADGGFRGVPRAAPDFRLPAPC